MARYPQGAPVRVSTSVRDTSGTLVDPGTLVLVVKLAQADGTLATTGTYSSPVKDSTGLYHQDVPAADLVSIGHYAYTWTAAGAGAGVAPGDFDIYDPYETSVLPLQDAKDSLNIPAATTAYDAEITAYVATIQGCLERYTGGPLVNRAFTERCTMLAGQTVIAVRQRPLVSVTQILDGNGAAISISAGLDLDVNAGLIRRKLAQPFYGPYYTGLPLATVLGVAGWGTSVPAAFGVAGRIILAHLWAQQRGPAALPVGGGELVQVPGFGYAIPRRAAELLDGSSNGIPFISESFI